MRPARSRRNHPDLAAHPKPGECGLCQRPFSPATQDYVDEWGYTYHLCRVHHHSVVTGLVRIQARRLARARSSFGTGADAIHPDVQEAVVEVLAEVLAERMLPLKEPVEEAGVDRR
jgi:hypothetical protein